MKETVYLIGAGPGDPELMTLKGKRLIDAADVIIYAGSLVNSAVLADHKEGAQIYNSASMTLDDVIGVIIPAVEAGKKVVRVHTGDPSIYGAIREQMDRLEAADIPYEVVPGVSSFTASASVLKKEFTLPDVSQTVICTRLEGRTPVPEREQLESLAAHQASMAIFLSVQMIDEVAGRLMQHYRPDTPIAVVQRATWPDQKIVVGTLEDIAAKVSEAGINKTAQILVGDFLGDQYSLSKLYDPSFSHEFRTASK
jgi:precorrin-4/cobalt-precorrin-4 C11-methyltransferase